MSLFFFASGALSRACCPRCTLPAPYTVWKLQRLKILRCSVWSQSPIISARRPRFRKTLHSRRCAASGEKKRWSIDGRITKKSTLKTLEKRFHQKLIASFLHRRNCSWRKLIFCASPGWRHLFFSPLVCFDVTGHAYYVCVLRVEKKHLAATASFWGQRSSNSAPALLFSIMWLSDKVNTALWHLKNSSSPPGIVRGVAQAAAAAETLTYPQESPLTIRTLFVCARGGSACFHC